MKAKRLGFLSFALVVALSACEMISPGPGPDPVDPPPTGGAPIVPPPTGGAPTPIPGPGDPTGAPTGTFGVSENPTGPFLNDRPEGIQGNDDERIISVSGGETFYAQVQYADADGIMDVRIDLVNSEPEGIRGPLGAEPRAGFTLGDPTGDCDLASSPTQVTCVYPITVAPGTPDIEELPGSGDEFAYVFRTYVADALGNESNEPIRGYVNID